MANDFCFVVTPFGGRFDAYYKEVYRPAIEAEGLRAQRADEFYGPRAIVTDIWQLTVASRLVLADLSGGNPNVFYELGLAHALAKPTVLVTNDTAHVPFDLQFLRVLTYDTAAPGWDAGLRDSIRRAMREVLAAPAVAVLQPFYSHAGATSPEAKSTRVAEIPRASLPGAPKKKRDKRLRDPHEVEEKIAEYRTLGMATSQIIERLVQYGVPYAWVVGILRKLDDQDTSDSG